MAKWWTSFSLLAAAAAFSSPARAEPPRTFASYMAAPGVCTPGTHVACRCGNGAQGSQVCETTGLRFSVCACASVNVNVPTLPTIPSIPFDWSKPHPRPQSHARSSGLGMLIGGGIAFTIGTGNLIWGIERLRDTRNDPLGIVMISTGGVAMAAGLPLTIVGIVFLATRGLHPAPSRGGLTLTPTANGFALRF